MTPFLRRLLATSLGLALLLPLLVSPVGAAPGDDKRAEAARLQRQIEAQSEKVSALDEKFNQARLRLEKAEAESHKASAALAVANEQFAAIRERLAGHAISSYVNGGSTTTIERLLRGSAQDVFVRRQYLEVAAADGRKALDALKVARQDLAEVRSRQDSARADARTAVGQVEADRRAVTRAIAAQKTTLGKVKGDLAELVQAEEARRAQAAESAEAARRRPATPPTTRAGTRGNPPPPPELGKVAKALVPDASRPGPAVASGAAAAVAEAKRQVGKPYVYGGSGPDSFDCSGLTSWAWRAGGISLPHSSSAQHKIATPIPFSDLQPGDLLFFYSDLHHVAIYVGGGQIVEASTTGTPVKYSSASRPHFVSAGRLGS